MKTWKIPTAVAQNFRANEYVAACWSVLCTTPNNNASYRSVYEDINGNGIFDSEDVKVFDVLERYNYTEFWGCGGYHDVEIVGDLPTANGFAVKEDGTTAAPVYFWNGSVINASITNGGVGLSEDFHVTDLTRADAILESSKS